MHKQPYLSHTNDSSASSAPSTKHYTYPGIGKHFILPAHASYDGAAATLAHTRSLAFLKPLVGGPWFDLEAIWEEHTRYEFGERAVAKTMSTMVAEPYVNDIPNLTGGIGRDALTAFYARHFIHVNPKDMGLRLVSRTLGIDRLIDEFVCEGMHDRVIDWLLPGVPPTNRKFEVPFTGIISIRGDRLFHEHIAWDQATLLRQLGLLPEYLPFPYPLPGHDPPPPGKRLEYRVPAVGVATARKLESETAVPSNELLEVGAEGLAVREVDDA
ncbi:uncharacterized protein K452DRAFT_283127 [Aplosporella prunicola CBS 121167]|uniref:SnoaL-like domain-containing protein n=1 Tax=Aplosporella prunicola CBS 121167 TaxID=1176127 RepID=A0A6A6BS54_9PEZI|nr:uncharacterized protein K452DRAFT_283127 [Aplosporella prunicola CBS 121167]KAF2146932.1 hypothetical protein K452DRAFT_283127 [Aplosporella prunicola CBS 121167]